MLGHRERIPPVGAARAAAGQAQLFLYVADYDSARVRAQLHAESRRFLGWLGVPPEQVIHVGAGKGVPDGGVHTALPTAFAALTEALAPVIQRIDERLAAETAPEARAPLLAATFVLTGLRVPREGMLEVFERMKPMKDSDPKLAQTLDGV